MKKNFLVKLEAYMFKYFVYFFQALFVYFFFILGKILGLRLSQKVYSYLFCLFGPYFKSHKVINANLKKFSPNILLSEKNKIIKNMWSNYGMTFIEYIFLNLYRKKNIFVELKNDYILKNLNNSKPVIFVSGHFANFEIMSMEITKKKIKLATIYRPLNNIFINPLMEYLRRKFVCKNQIKKGIAGVKEAMQYINNGYSIAMMIDQRVSEGEKISLFGSHALTTTLPAQLALKYNLLIVPVFIKRKLNNDFFMEFYEPIKSSKFKNKYDLSRKINKLFEKMLLENTGQWIWTHNRWK